MWLSNIAAAVIVAALVMGGRVRGYMEGGEWIGELQGEQGWA